MDTQKLIQFLVKAKKNTYALGGEDNVKKFLDGRKEYIYKEGNFKYVDIYKGHEEFEGREEVFHNNKTIWSMKYKGKVLSNKLSADKIYLFLRKALKKIPDDKPFRGPEELVDGEYKYVNDIIGDIDNFTGEEKIFYDKKLLYKLVYSGEIISGQ